MTTLAAWPAWGDGDSALSSTSAPVEHAVSNPAVDPPTAVADRPRGGVSQDADAYEGALAWIFSELFQPACFGAGTWTDSRRPETAGQDVDQHPEAIYLLAASLLGARRIARAAFWLRRLDSMTVGRPDGEEWGRRSAFLWAIYAEQTGDLASVLEQSAKAAPQTSPALAKASDARSDHPGWSLLKTVDTIASEKLPLLAARAHIELGQLHQGETILEDHYGFPGELETSQPSILATLACRQGRLRDGQRLAEAALDSARRQDSTTELVDVEARLALGEVFFERNELDAAQEQLHAALELCCLTGATSWMWAVEMDLARLSVAQLRPVEAVERLHHLRHLKDAGFLTQSLKQKLNQIEVDCRLQLGDLEGAVLVARSSPPGDIDNVTRARVDLRCGRPDHALTKLKADRSPYPAVQMRQAILTACAEHQLGRRHRATQILRRTVEAAQPEGYLRPFLDEATRLLPLLRSLGLPSWNGYEARLLLHAERLAPSASTDAGTNMLEPLTDRERQVLQFLPSHLNVRQISVQMCLSVNTIKTHVRAIYRKTGAMPATRPSPSPAATACCSGLRDYGSSRPELVPTERAAACCVPPLAGPGRRTLIHTAAAAATTMPATIQISAPLPT
jgi:DNA-binding NarL/FixJ family response regulator